MVDPMVRVYTGDQAGGSGEARVRCIDPDIDGSICV
jgi:hypothetical protein